MTPENSKPGLLIVEDDEELRSQMAWALSPHYEVFQAGSREEALERIREHHPQMVTLDLGLPPQARGAEEGFATLADIHRADPTTKVVVVTGQGEGELARRAIASGAHDYFVKPVEVAELKIVLGRALRLRELESEGPRSEPAAAPESFEDMLGQSAPMQAVFAAVRKVATATAPVLVTGESGAGKELVARAIHRLSGRREGPFVAINCGAIPSELLESELFGHEKGSFTGAHTQRKGRLEAAHGGTLFLDEIGELPLALQVKLLRVLQEQSLERVGGRQPIRVDARLISASNRDLQAAMAEDRFRQDLYFRVAVVVIAVPPLRERGADILLLANAMLERYGAETNRQLQGLTPEALAALEDYPWPGNVRELENRIRRAVVMSEGPKISAVDLELAEGEPATPGLRALRATFEREAVVKALARNGGNVSRAAAELGVSRPTLYDLMEKLGIARK